MKRFILVAVMFVGGAAYAGDVVIDQTKVDVDQRSSVAADVDVDAKAGLGLDLGVDYSVRDGMLLSTYLRGGGAVNDSVSAGLRFGIMATDGLALHALPLDLFVRGHFGGAYVEGLVGPYWMTRARDFDAHLALGAGADLGGMSLGVELGWLNPSPMIGARASFGF